jgi:membrane fusion protein (multidrug efflux system)
MSIKSLGYRLVLPATLLALTACRPKGPGGSAGPGAGGGVAMPVVAVAAERRPVIESVSLVGTLAANEEIEVKTETDGMVKEVRFQEGQVVEQGELLVRLDDTKLRAELADAEARLKLSEASFARVKQLFEDRLISQQEFDQAASTFEVSQATLTLRRRQLDDSTLHAPFRGRTGARTVSPGQVITRNTVITWLVDLDPMKVEMNVPERYLGQTRIGQRIQFDVAAYPGRRFEGEIYFIAPRLDLATRTALVKTRIPNPEGLLKAGMVANLEVQLTIQDDAVVIPEAALLSNGDASFVFVVGVDETVAMRPVVVGQRMPRWAAIASGLAEGETVVVEGHQKIGPGMKVALAPPEKAAVYRTKELRPAAPGEAAPPVPGSASGSGAGK